MLRKSYSAELFLQLLRQLRSMKCRVRKETYSSRFLDKVSKASVHRFLCSSVRGGSDEFEERRFVKPAPSRYNFSCLGANSLTPCLWYSAIAGSPIKSIRRLDIRLSASGPRLAKNHPNKLLYPKRFDKSFLASILTRSAWNEWLDLEPLKLVYSEAESNCRLSTNSITLKRMLKSCNRST